MKKRLLSLLLAVVLCIGLLPVGALAEDTTTTVQADTVNADGTIKAGGGFIATGPIYTGSKGNDTLSGKYYIVQNDATVKGNLTVDCNDNGGLVLCADATLTVEGALICSGTQNKFYIYGQTATGKSTGRLIIKNSNGDGAAIRAADGAVDPQLGISSGELELHGGNSGKLIDGITLMSTKPIHAGTLDGDPVAPSVWYKDPSEGSVDGRTLVLAYCEHDHTDDFEFIPDKDSTTTHHMRCKVCGFTWTSSEACFEDGALSGIQSNGETGHTLKCICGRETTEPHNEEAPGEGEAVPTLDGKGHVSKSCVCGYTSEEPEAHTYIKNTNGSCDTCGFTPFMSDSEGNLYEKEDYEKAFEKAANSDGAITLTLVSEVTGEGENIWTKSIEFDYPGKSVTLDMNDITLSSTGEAALVVSGGTLIIEDNATLEGASASGELSSTPAIKVTDGALTFNGTVNATGGAKNSSAAPAILVEGGTVTFGQAVNATAAENDNGPDTAAAPAIKVTGGKVIFSDVTATGGLSGAPGNKLSCEPAIYANDGELEFNGNLSLYGGLTLEGNASLTHGLTKGRFYPKPLDSTGSVDGFAVSVENSNVYKNGIYGNVNKLLADKHVFVKISPSGENDKYLTASYQYLAWDVTIEEHEHEFDAKNGYKCYCGVTCDHRNAEGKLDFSNDGKCPTCGKPCDHTADRANTNGHWYCDNCGAQVYAYIQKGYIFDFYTTLKDALAAAENGQTVKLVDDIDNSNQTACLTGDNKTVTLNLNGKNITGGWIYVGIDQDGKVIYSSGLNITGSGSFDGMIGISAKGTLDLSAWDGGTIRTVSSSQNGSDESTLISGENKGTITSLKFYSWPSGKITNTKLTGGTYGSIPITMNSDGYILFSDLLAPGYAFQYADGSGSFVNYATKATYDADGVIYNVKVVKCTTHEDTKSVDANGNITDGADGHCDYCNANLEAATVATLTTADGKTYFYTDLPSAFKAASSKGGTVTLQKDVENVSEMLVIEGFLHVTLDLNGKKITGSGSSSTLLGISNLSDVTICDSSESKAGQIKCTASGYAVYVSEGCDLTISGGTFEGTDDATTSAPGYAVGVDGAKLTITGGTFNSAVDAKDKLTVNDGIFKKAVTISARGAKIKGGTFEGAFSMSAQPDEFSGGTFKQQASFSNVSNILTGGEFQKGIKSTDKKLYELLAENKAYQTADDWLDDNTTYFYNDTGSSVTVVEAPIHSVTLTVNGTSVELDEDNKGRFSVELGTDVTLTASCEGSMAAPYGTWYSVYGDEDGETGPVVQQSTGKSLSYTLPAKDLTIGTHTYRVSFCSENPGSVGQVTGYYKVVQITITVEKIDLANAEVTIDPWPTDGKVRFSPFYRPAASVLAIFNNTVTNKITVKANNTERELSNSDYTYEGATATQVGKYTLTITATKSCENYTGSKTFDWEVTPCQLYNPSYLGNQKYTKTYDGTTTLPESYHYYALFSYKEDQEREVDWRNDTSESNYEVTAAAFVSPDAGENKPINQTITLKNENFVFAPTEIIKIKGITTTDKTMTYTNFTTKEGYGRADTTFNIEKATMPDFNKEVTLEVINDLEATYTVDLPTLPELKSPKTYGSIRHEVDFTTVDKLTNGYNVIDHKTVGFTTNSENGKLQLTFKAPAVPTSYKGSIGAIQVTVKTDNYNDVTLTVNLEAVNKPQPDVTVTAEPSTITYGTTLKDVKPVFTATCNGQPVEGTVRWAMPDRYMPNVSVKNLEWHFTPADSDAYRGAGDVTPITVKPADLTGQPTFEKITQSGKTLSEVNVDLSGITGVNGETLASWRYTFTWVDGDSTIIQPNKSYSWTFEAKDGTYDVTNYNVLTGSVVLYPVSTGYSNQVKKQIEEFEAKKRGELPESDSAFRDVTEDDYFFDAVQWAAENGITGGVTANRFGPSQDCSRGQTMTFLWRAMGEPEPESYDSALADVPSGSYFYDAVHWAMGEGVTTGAGKGIFAPDATVTRGQFVTFLYRLANAKFDGMHPFADVPAGSYYEKAIAWAYAEGITKGISATKFAPDAPCTRAQIITFLYRYFNR